jgi:DNA-binding CsgD family transcriptional regulator
MSDVEIDEKTRAALGRLTAGEKDCLRRKLRHQTAKEIALDLGVSPHAIEKRLKMTRAKLGLSSSVEAGRLLVAAERYQRTAPQHSDLPALAGTGHKSSSTPLIAGGIAMTLIAAAVLAAMLQSATPAPNAPIPTRAVPADAPPPRAVTHAPEDMVEATPAEIQIVVRDTFAGFDKNRSGYIEPEEAPIAARFGSNEIAREGPVERRAYKQDANGRPTGEVLRVFTVSLEQARAEYVRQGDTNGDGKVDFWEFERWQAPIMAKRGVPKWWKEEINRPIAE